VAVEASDTAAASQKTPSTLSIQYIITAGDQKVAQLLSFLGAHTRDKTIVYALTCAAVEWLAAALPKLPGGDAILLLALHGNMKQSQVRIHVHLAIFAAHGE
jgi:ATP-dependent RNA helicase DDX55/SPB4